MVTHRGLRACLLHALLCAGALGSPFEELKDFVRAKGGLVDLCVEELPGRGRAAVACEDLPEGHTILRLPHALAVKLDTYDKPSEAHAVKLLKHRARKPEWAAFWRPYFEALPAPGSGLVLTKDTCEAAALPELQDAAMLRLAQQHQNYTRAVYEGRTEHASRHLERETGAPVPWGDFQHAVALVTAYPFTRAPGPNKTPKRVMLPLADMLNHANAEHANVATEHGGDGGPFTMRTSRAVAAGEELAHTYGPQLQRPDFSLFHYGFVQDLDPPRLAALDIAGGNLYDGFAFDELGPEYQAGGLLATPEEVARLAALAGGFPTTPAQDAARLAGEGGPLTPCARLAVRFRLARKQALAYWVERLQGELLEDTVDLEEEEEGELVEEEEGEL